MRGGGEREARFMDGFEGCCSFPNVHAHRKKCFSRCLIPWNSAYCEDCLGLCPRPNASLSPPGFIYNGAGGRSVSEMKGASILTTVARQEHDSPWLWAELLLWDSADSVEGTKLPWTVGRKSRRKGKSPRWEEAFLTHRMKEERRIEEICQLPPPFPPRTFWSLYQPWTFVLCRGSGEAATPTSQSILGSIRSHKCRFYCELGGQAPLC